MPRFEPIYEVTPPWDIAAPQPAVVRLVERGAFSGRVLDVACGPGRHSVELANAMLYSSLIDQTVTLPLDGLAFEKKLQQLIAESRFEKKVTEVVGEDFTQSFVR